MANFVVVGTSGVGKSFLEDSLVATGRFAFLPKYTNRPPRPNENPNQTICLSSDQFQGLTNSNQFFFTLDYAGFHYAWKHSDLVKNSKKSIILPLTLEALSPFLSQNPAFIPVFLRLNLSNLALLRHRLSSRGSFDIKNRLSLARREISRNPFYARLVKNHHGLVFTIKDDSTIPQKVVPFLLSFCYHML